MSYTGRAVVLLALVGCASTPAVVEAPAPVTVTAETYDGPPPQVLESHCHMGDRLACRTLGELYLAGIGTEKSEGLAVALFLLSCDQGDARACYMAGDVYSSSGDSADAVAAARCYKKACSLGEERGCEKKARRVSANVLKKEKRH